MPKSYQLLCYEVPANIFLLMYTINPVQDKSFLNVDFLLVSCQRNNEEISSKIELPRVG